MKSKAVALGHPIHPMLIPFPFAFLTGAVFFDSAGRLLDRPDWWTTGGHLIVVGIMAAILAAVPGLIDYIYTVPPNSTGKARATKHMLANSAAVTLFAAALWIRGGVDTRPDLVVLAIELIALMSLSMGAYMGGTLVTRNLISVDHRYARAGKWCELAVAPRRDEPIVVAKRDELQVDQMKLLRIGSRRVVLGRTENGYVAFEDRCTHRGGSLAGGVMLCGTVQCLWHGSQFDVSSGAVRNGPADKPIRTFRIHEDKEDVRLIL
jgi:nitrite reductase/ring-hydroxylating ferredoxin subunit/uncharacterized membrane protein